MIPETKKPCTAATVQDNKNESNQIQGYYTITPFERQPDFAIHYEGAPLGRICPGDTVFIEKIKTMDNGNIVAVVIDDTVQLRRCVVTPNTVMLDTDDGKPPQEFSLSDCPAIIGRAIYCQSPLVAQEVHA